MHVLIWVLIIVYGVLIVFIFLYSLMQLSLALAYRKNKKKPQERADELTEFPEVTIQLPIFNEKYVAERLLSASAKLIYPKDKLEIQVLDDSTDETYDMIAAKVQEIRETGVNMVHIHRVDRKGFKAGALAHGLTICKGEFVGIFDADFIPEPNFLMETIPFFKDEKIGLVQTRWEHLNKNYNLLTKLQAFGLDAHFSVEQAGRNAAGHFINFNGTAGIWRKSCIDDAGGWASDTLTEDLDLSYRAQLKGWQFKYIEGVGSPAELPAAMNAVKTQQYRWNKGAAECAVKNLDKVIKSNEVDTKTKVHAIFHLMNSFVFVCIFLTGILSVPLMFVKNMFYQYNYLFEIAAVFSVSFVFLTFFYWTSSAMNYKNKRLGFVQFLSHFPIFLSVYMGLSLHNALAVFEGYAGRKSPFVRTPKFNIVQGEGAWKNNKYLRKSVNPLTYVEMLLTIYFAAATISGLYLGDGGLLPFHIMLTFGFGIIAAYSFSHSQS